MGEKGYEVDKDMVSKFSFSGRGIFACYINRIKENLYTMRSNTDKGKTEELIFHAMFGTHHSDLSLLPKITNRGNWHTRSEFGSEIGGFGTGIAVQVKPIRFKYWSRTSAAQQTTIMGSSQPQSWGVNPFAGQTEAKVHEQIKRYFAEGTGSNFLG